MPHNEVFLLTTTPEGVVIERLDPESMDEIGLQLPNLKCVVFRTGGTSNFKWNRTVPQDQDEADKTFADTLRMGYPAYLVNYFESVRIGLPETYSPDFPLEIKWE